MKAAIIACPEVKPQGVLSGQEFSQIDVCQGQVFCDRFYVGVTLTAGCKVLFFPRPTSNSRASRDYSWLGIPLMVTSTFVIWGL